MLEHAPCTVGMRMLRLVVTVVLRTQRCATKHKPNHLENERRPSCQEGCHVRIVAITSGDMNGKCALKADTLEEQLSVIASTVAEQVRLLCVGRASGKVWETILHTVSCGAGVAHCLTVRDSWVLSLLWL